MPALPGQLLSLRDRGSRGHVRHGGVQVEGRLEQLHGLVEQGIDVERQEQNKNKVEAEVRRQEACPPGILYSQIR